MAAEPNTPDPADAAEAERKRVDALSLSDHEKSFAPRLRRREPPPAATAASAIATPEPPAATTDEEEGERDDQGRLKIRHRAAKDKARADDVPRINELTKKLRDAEAERDELKQKTVVAPPPAAAPVTPVAAARAPRMDDLDEKGQPKFTTMDAYFDARDAYNRQQWSVEQQQQAEVQRINASWKTRVAAAIEKHPDFEAVALKAPTKIPPGSLTDAWILESTTGAEILYELQTNDEERERILALPPVQQAEALALLGQRLVPPRVQAAPTRSAAAPSHEPAPRPPNLVRTGPLRTGEEPPDPEKASLADFEKAYPVRRRLR